MVEIEPQGNVVAGVYPIVFAFVEKDKGEVARVSVEIEIIDALLPKQELIFTQWFYTDCLMQYYGTEAFSEKHWKIIENFMHNARKYGM
ncbi:MAG: hypothetical protein IKK11_02620, partial [Oscillospiraceae bacterium]|nr:hypothetical protein [Oscillospiraceae bacterium]